MAEALKPNTTIIAGESLLHPLCIASVAVLIVNDHCFKHAMPGVITGKLSDFAGLVFFPHLLVSLGQCVAAALGRPLRPTTRSFALILSAVGAVFVAIKVSTLGDRWYEQTLTVLYQVVGSLHDDARSTVFAKNTADATDIIAISALIASYWVGVRTW